MLGKSLFLSLSLKTKKVAYYLFFQSFSNSFIKYTLMYYYMKSEGISGITEVVSGFDFPILPLRAFILQFF